MHSQRALSVYDCMVMISNCRGNLHYFRLLRTISVHYPSVKSCLIVSSEVVFDVATPIITLNNMESIMLCKCSSDINIDIVIPAMEKIIQCFPNKLGFEDCRITSNATREIFTMPNPLELIEFSNCFLTDGTIARAIEMAKRVTVVIKVDGGIQELSLTRDSSLAEESVCANFCSETPFSADDVLLIKKMWTKIKKIDNPFFVG